MVGGDGGLARFGHDLFLGSHARVSLPDGWGGEWRVGTVVWLVLVMTSSLVPTLKSPSLMDGGFRSHNSCKCNPPPTPNTRTETETETEKAQHDDPSNLYINVSRRDDERHTPR